MPSITPVAQTLWTPDGDVPLREKDVIPLSPQEVRMLSLLHEFAHTHQINIFCKRCSTPITGQNNDSSPYVSVNCQCREWRYTP